MYFGLTNSPATFQTMMNEIFEDLITQVIISIYLDDILIFTSMLEEHRPISRMVMEWLREHKLYLRHEKCKFEKTRIEYLGVIILHNKVEMDPVKIAGVSEWPTLSEWHGLPTGIFGCTCTRTRKNPYPHMRVRVKSWVRTFGPLGYLGPVPMAGNPRVQHLLIALFIE
jgi:hypothetical protein